MSKSGRNILLDLRWGRIRGMQMSELKKGKSIFKKCMKILGILLGALLAVVVIYLVYVLLRYYRIPDMQELTVQNPQTVSEENNERVLLDTEYEIITYNIGFGAYSPDYTFFMDGGKSSRAFSEDAVLANITGAVLTMKEQAPDFILFQEVDFDSDRSYHVDERKMLLQHFAEYYETFAVNYDSPFLFYPFTEPHGSSKSGMAVYSRYEITSALRRSLPVSEGFSKFLDLDRCYSINRIPVENGKELVIFAVHLSAYGNSEQVREGQLAMLREDMEKELQAGNYVICGGDFNHDLKADESVTKAESWAYPLSREKLGDGMIMALDLLAEDVRNAMADTARNNDIPYEPGVSYTVTVDGFIISENVEMLLYETMDTGFAYSDHNPVRMCFRLKP